MSDLPPSVPPAPDPDPSTAPPVTEADIDPTPSTASGEGYGEALPTAPAPPAYSMVASGLPPGAHLSSKGRRFGAFLLDFLLAVVTLVIGWLIWSVILWGRGQSPAKQLLKMRVYAVEKGRGASWGEMVMRELVGKFLLGVIPFWTLVNGICVLVDDEARALWDRLARTLVIDDPNGEYDPRT